MLLKLPIIHKEFVKEHQYKFMQIWSKHIIHQTLKSCWGSWKDQTTLLTTRNGHHES